MTHSTARRNPYVIGRPIDESELLFGRESLFNFIEDNLKQDIKVILLHGQRRIGKSSVLRNIPNFVAPEQFAFITFDLEYHSRETLSRILAAIATEIIEQLELDLDRISLPDITELETDPYIFYRQFLPKVYQEIGNQKLVLLLDEFDALNNDSSDTAVEHLFPYLRSIIELPDNQLFIILCVGRQSADMPNLLSIFNNVPYQEIGLLDAEDAAQLITQPAKNSLNYEQNAIDEIYRLTAGHPYFIQVICFHIFVQARSEEKWQVTRTDVDAIVEQAIESAEAGLAWFWDGLTILEQIVFSSVAEAQKQAFPENPLTLLKKYGIIETEELVQAARQLVEKGLLNASGNQIKVEIVRLWLLKRHPIDTDIQALIQQQEQKINVISQRNITQHQERKLKLLNDKILKEAREKDTDYSPNKNLRFRIVVVGLIVSISSVALGIYQFFNSCEKRQYFILDQSCVVQHNNINYLNVITNISRGDRTVFYNKENKDFNRALEEFKKTDYTKATELFKKAVALNPQDPEVLIYYNNALARQKGTPMTVAVSVPVENPKGMAEDILRGVAQAQNKFNQQGGFNGKLLEIVIANDANKTENAKQIAQVLIKDSSILGVIGHSSSNLTQVALAEYKKANLPIISSTSISDSLSGNVFFRTVPSNAAIGKRLAEYTKSSRGLNKVVIFKNPDSKDSKSLSQAFIEKFEPLGGQVVREIDLTKPELNVNKEIKTIVFSDRAEAAVLFPATQKQASVTLEIAKANADLISTKNPNNPGLSLLGGSLLYGNTTLQKGKKAVEGLIVAIPWFRDSPNSKNFAQAALKQWGGPVSWRTATSYDATQAFIKTLTNISPNFSRENVLQGLKQVNLSPNETSGEPLKFTDNGERQSQPVLVQVKGGKFTLVPSVASGVTPSKSR
ncbi:ABC transporter substrate-binding protein [Tolypothrix sp. PCC 7601]|uniref:ABC transporter substrate-binding protein n=2 Tax=Tolypothrix TaxID=111782 RepID=UPI0005EAA371|nr:ABC transporter substrate-binding protein [Tolypothrix sp. PCC 7601]MBE9086664.1 ABC transporter substrate-binding protein [Tolypothrix sp. LEGE 11397]UYD29938.1 ABC transporter substrate-binding protein [Tolypothrix sp. PCC 7712]BAY88257.1 hypothetical protein NIES3275_02320 [Microchaete diplosiphon NIES-3275]EKF02402.1 putative ABC superfamily ATP binding protein [Tolypothrix sp. PCC 7601]UYD37615.1 ABC transporter substrate-binding protein [Tolypothrix sp. PCC 7601]